MSLIQTNRDKRNTFVKNSFYDEPLHKRTLREIDDIRVAAGCPKDTEVNYKHLKES